MSRNKADVQDSSSHRAIVKFVYISQSTVSNIVYNCTTLFYIYINMKNNVISHTSYTCFEDLSNELLYEILEKLDTCDINKSFSNLNNRLQNLINSSSLLLVIKLDSKSKSLVEDHCQHVIIPNSHRIRTLSLDDCPTDPSLIDTFFKHCTIDSSFQRLKYINLYRVKQETLLTILLDSKSLPRLSSLNILMSYKNYHDLDLVNIYQLIFSLSTLEYNRLCTPRSILPIYIPHVINQQFSTIEYLVIDHCCTLNELNSILQHTPQLRRLSCHGVIDSDEELKEDLSLKLPHLKSICFETCDAPFDEFEVFIKKISSQLQIVSISIYWNKDYLDSNRWERLIKEYMPQLKKFYFHFNQHFDDDDRQINLSDSTDEFINQFNSLFWIERKLFCEKKWIDLHEHMKSDHRIIRLTIQDSQYTELNWEFINKVKSTFKAIQFTHLEIEYDNMCIHMLLDILSSLPNIESLKLSFTPILDLESVFIEDTKNYLSVLAINKITKVKLGQVIEEQEIQFYINLCPHMQYLQVESRLSDESIWYTCFENLSIELLYEILDYLDAYDIYESFSNLNNRLQTLIISSSLLLRIKHDSESKHSLEDHCQQVIIPNSHRIRFLHLYDFSTAPSLIDTFFNHCTINSSFYRLESISLHRIKTEQLLTSLCYLKSLPRLFSLSISIRNTMNDNYYDLGNIYSLIFSLSSLKHNTLGTVIDKLQINIPHVINNRFSIIEYMHINDYFTLNQLNSLLHYTPQIRRLFCHGVIKSDKKFKTDLSLKLLHLKYICFEEVSVSFDEFEVFIKEISSQLQTFRINISSYKNYLDGNRWEQLIKEYMPQLKKFYFSFHQNIKNNKKTNLIDSTDGFINRFSSPFWIERKWFRELKIFCQTMYFSIFPYKKEWIDLHEHKDTDTYSRQNSIEHNYIANREKTDHGVIQLTIEDYEGVDLNWRSIKKLIPTFRAIKFTHLNIEHDSVCIHLLLDILRLLPNIESLKFRFMLIFPLQSLSIEHSRDHLLVSAINKITKVKLGQVTEEEEIQFFINLFPQMEYLEVHCLSNTDVPLLMELISMNRRTRISNLCYLCFNFRMADENLVRTLAKIIDSETVNDNYTIQRSGNKIIVHWKL
ncbi:unnamed protein product [Adineta steineri]|uniref:F-box domain-containing protein n=1 Tax=Adineta steineri TaxID=433720 RepID=A0A815SDQ3_9BILA|nr:unnamed protein product [Adineta steineri]CAF1491415.1 unnamed protein product [Adineta steineri]